MSFWKELRRRNVFRAGAAYVIVTWLVIQISATVFPLLGLPAWTARLVTILLLLGLPIALILAWLYEVTPEGIKKTRDVPVGESTGHVTGRKLNYVVAGVLVLAVAFVAADRFVLPRQETGPASNETASSSTPTSSRPEAAALPPSAPESSVAVLLFEYFSADASKSWLAAGLSEEIIHSLANVPGLVVAARTSSFAFGSSTATVPDIARELNVENVLEGSIRLDGEDLRVAAQLIDARTGLHRWSRVYERRIVDLFAVQDEIARDVAESLGGVLTNTGEPSYISRRLPTASFDAYALYLDALSLWRERGAEAQRRAADLLREAIAIDPTFARAHSALGNVYYTLVFYAGMPSGEMVALADQAAREALRLDAGDSDALSLLGTLARGRFDWANAIRFAEAAVGADPRSSIARQRYAETLLGLGYLRRGLAQIERAAEIDPLAASVRSVAAAAAAVNGNQVGALAAANAARALGSPRAGQIESWVHVERGEFEPALAARLESVLSMRRWSEHVEPVYAALTDRTRVLEAVAVLASAPEPVAFTEGFFFYEYAILGEIEKAVSALERLDGTTDTFLSLWLPELTALRGVPGFADAMRRHGFADYWAANGMPDLCEQRSDEIVCH